MIQQLIQQLIQYNRFMTINRCACTLFHSSPLHFALSTISTILVPTCTSTSAICLHDSKTRIMDEILPLLTSSIDIQKVFFSQHIHLKMSFYSSHAPFWYTPHKAGVRHVVSLSVCAQLFLQMPGIDFGDFSFFHAIGACCNEDVNLVAIRYLSVPFSQQHVLYCWLC